MAGVGQADDELTFIGRIAPPRQIALRLQLLEDWGQRVRFQEERFAECLDGLIILFRKRDEDDPLRLGQAERIEDRLIGPAERQVGRIDRKAQKIRELRIRDGGWWSLGHGRFPS